MCTNCCAQIMRQGTMIRATIIQEQTYHVYSSYYKRGGGETGEIAWWPVNEIDCILSHPALTKIIKVHIHSANEVLYPSALLKPTQGIRSKSCVAVEGWGWGKFSTCPFINDSGKKVVLKYSNLYLAGRQGTSDNSKYWVRICILKEKICWSDSEKSQCYFYSHSFAPKDDKLCQVRSYPVCYLF